MPLSDIAIAHCCFPKYLGYARVQLFINGNIPNYSLKRHEERWAFFRKTLQNAGNLNLSLVHFKKSFPGFLVSAVATLEPKYLVQNKDREKEIYALSGTAESESETVQTEHLSESLSEDSEDIHEREKLRRLRISKANRGNTPWNKGRKHSPETLQLIRERTRIAMQSPKVKKKLAKLGHKQSKETRKKIAVGVRVGWQKRRERLMLQETCLFDWQNLVAEAARGGFEDEEEYQWDSYSILSKKLQQEWLDSIELRKTVPRVQGSKRAPKSPEQRRKIAEAIAAKWADPEYRTRVCSGLAKYHGIPEGAERKVGKKPSGEDSPTVPRKKNSLDRFTANNVNGRTQLKKKNVPKFKDPSAKTKLEMLKSIRAQRVAPETKKIEALERAKLLIAEAQKAAKALEVAAMRSPVARASLIEAQKLIAEATRSIESIENGEPSSLDDCVEEGGETPVEYADQRYHLGMNGIIETTTPNVDQRYHKMINGFGGNLDTDLHNRTIMDDEVDQKHQLLTNLGGYELGLESLAENADIKECMYKQLPDHNGSLRLNGVSSVNGVKLQSHEEDVHPAAKTVTKKWVRGRLVEVEEGD